MRIKKFSTASSHNFSMVGTALVVATALLLGTVVVMMIGVNQQAEAIAIDHKGVKIDVGEDDDDEDISVEVTEKKKNGAAAEGPVVVKIKLNSSRPNT
jgi:2-methylaconitate cis-trans-isomerase PrpF